MDGCSFIGLASKIIDLSRVPTEIFLLSPGAQRTCKWHPLINCTNTGVHAARYSSFIRKFFLAQSETFLTFSRLQYQNFHKTLLAKTFELQCFAHAH